MMMGPPPGRLNDKFKEPKPKNLKEVPGYLKRLIFGFFGRLFYIFRLVWETNKWILLVMLIFALLGGLLPVWGAYINKEILNKLVEAYNINVLGTEGVVLAEALKAIALLLILRFVYLFLSKIITSLNMGVTKITGDLVVNHIKLKIMNKAKEIDIARFDVPEFYEKLENANREADHRPIQIIDAIFAILSSGISLVSFISILWFISPWAPFLILIMAIPTSVVNFIYRKKHVSYMRHRSKDRRQMSYFSDLLTNKDMVKEIRLFGLSTTFIEKFKAVFKHYFKGLKKLIIHEQGWHILTAFLSTVINSLLFFYIAAKVGSGELNVGDSSLYTGALTTIATGVSTIIARTATVYEGTLFINNMIDFMKEKKTVKPLDPASPEKIIHGGHTIDFKNVSFAYPATDRLVLKNVNLKINEGETVVLVGLNGAGKTTLIKLLTRLYDPTDGEILLDGKNIKSYEPEELYKIFGIIFQDFGKYAVSVKENIAYGAIDKEHSIERIEKAASESGADRFIEKMPEGYETPLMRIFEETGTELSIGQWQKLAISRAFYGESDILILDEPTASLDAIAEQEIFSQFDALRKDKTTIFVSHRLSSATVASKIVVLDGGVITEEGTHSELMAKRGTYHKLFTTQAKRYFESVHKDDFSGE